jgi:hypothetical protein
LVDPGAHGAPTMKQWSFDMHRLGTKPGHPLKEGNE